MSDSQDTWGDIQALRNKRSSLREKLQRRKRERETVVADALSIADAPSSPRPVTASSGGGLEARPDKDVAVASKVLKDSSYSHVATLSPKPASEPVESSSVQQESLSSELIAEVERQLLLVLDDVLLNLPAELPVLRNEIGKLMGKAPPEEVVENLLQKFSAQMLVSLSSPGSESDRNTVLCVESVDHKKVSAVSADLQPNMSGSRKRKLDGPDGANSGVVAKESRIADEEKDTTIESLLSMQSAKERENKKLNEEIVQLLSQPTAKEQSLVEKFKSQGGAQVKEFCQFGTKEECQKMIGRAECDKLHFKKIINKHTDESLGDCSFLNTCYHMDSCKYVHYEIDYPDTSLNAKTDLPIAKKSAEGSTILYPPQWIQCDLRSFDMSVLGKFAVVMADPPWDIHMELPYGTMQDDEMRRLNVPILQDDGYIFLWVTGRAMELGRECLTLWGYQRVDELIWVKANQLQRIIRTGRTGHWLNHGKEHCLVGVKGDPKGINRGLDCDVIVAEVRATSHKPDEIYGIIERLAPGSRKIELFGRPHNVQPNWITLGNQVDGVKLIDPEVVRAFKKKYPDGNCLKT